MAKFNRHDDRNKKRFRNKRNSLEKDFKIHLEVKKNKYKKDYFFNDEKDLMEEIIKK